MARETTSNHERIDAEYERLRRYSDYREFTRGKRDGRLGYPLAGISEIYIEGYILGRMVAQRVRRDTPRFHISPARRMS